ncbi:MAG: hypothetical protein ACE5HT_11620 [Gemmatimonadales bacterium]
MKLSTLLSIYAAVAVIFCLGLLLVPAFWIALYGATPDPQATLLVRLIGALVSGLAVMAWVGRKAEASESRNAMVLGLTVLNGVAAVVSVLAALSGVYNRLAGGPLPSRRFSLSRSSWWGELACRPQLER